MDWKEFFRPTVLKGVLAIIFLIIGNYSIANGLVIVDCFTPPCPPPVLFAIEGLNTLELTLAVITIWPFLLTWALSPILALLLTVVWVYVLAAFIMWVLRHRLKF